MKKMFSILLAVAFLGMCSFANADERDLTYKGITELETFSGATASGDLEIVYDASDGNVKTISAVTGATRSGDITFQTNLLATGRVNTASTVASSSTDLAPSSLPYVVLLKSVSGAGGLDTTPGTTLQNGTSGQVLVLVIKSLMTSGTWIVTPTTCTGFTSLTFDTKGDLVSLLYVDDTIGWIVTGNSGATITMADYAD